MKTKNNLILKQSSFKINNDEPIEITDTAEKMAIDDFNNDRIKINGKHAKELDIQGEILSFFIVFYSNEKMERQKLARLLVQMIHDNLPSVVLIEADGYKYLRLDVRQRSIEMNKP